MPVYCYKCPSCGTRSEILRTVAQHTALSPECPQGCPSYMETDFTRQKPLIAVRKDFHSQTQYDVMDPRAFAGKGSADRRAFVNETYGKERQSLGRTTFRHMADLEAHAEANDATVISDTHLEPVGA